MAVISTARDAAPLSGLYAIRSIVMPRRVQTTIARIIESQGFIPPWQNVKNTTYPPTMMISPWAKFSILAMPYTIVYPRAISAYTLPSDMPLTR